MAGCYGNSSEDRHFEAELHEHLDEQDDGEDAAMEAREDRKREEME